MMWWRNKVVLYNTSQLQQHYSIFSQYSVTYKQLCLLKRTYKKLRGKVKHACKDAELRHLHNRKNNLVGHTVVLMN